ncbi:transposase [Streptomyces sp. NBC_01618]|nr:transposase [Streptomyces sp. NBC_01618]
MPSARSPPPTPAQRQPTRLRPSRCGRRYEQLACLSPPPVSSTHRWNPRLIQYRRAAKCLSDDRNPLLVRDLQPRPTNASCSRGGIYVRLLKSRSADREDFLDQCRSGQVVGPRGSPDPAQAGVRRVGADRETLHLLAVVDLMDDTYRRQRHKQLTVQESCRNLARNICHGKKGTIHQAYWDGMEELGSLGLAVNAVVLWTTMYIDAAVASFARREPTSGTRMSHGCRRPTTRI